MNREDIIKFFDDCAPRWDMQIVRSDDKIKKILDCAGVKCGANVLDVACGTGVLFKDYLNRDVNRITGVDISSKMIEIAKSKFNDDRIEFINADIQEVKLDCIYDCCVIYNAFPHFIDPKNLISSLYEKIVDGGRLTIAHGASREQINSHHEAQAAGVSTGLMSIDELSQLLSSLFKVDIAISNDDIYIASAIKA